jgi:hypothetical protein
MQEFSPYAEALFYNKIMSFALICNEVFVKEALISNTVH